MSVRRIAGATLATVGAVGATAGAYLDWIDDQAPASQPQDMPLSSLYESTAVTETASSYWSSVAIPLAVVTLLAVLGAILRSRIVLTIGFLVGLATVVMWVIQKLADDDADFSFGDLESGFWICLLGLAVMLIGITSMGRGEDDEAEVADGTVSNLGSDMPDITELGDASR